MGSLFLFQKKADRLTSACEKYMELHGVDPIHVIHADHMSDEASGPEDDGEAVEDWRRRMSVKKGYPPGIDIDGMVFMEVLKNPWRSNEVIKHSIIEKLRSYSPETAWRYLS